jgi:hypothetical protein
MSRNRVIYQSEGLYASSGINSTGSGDHRQLRRVQSANYSFEIARQDVNQFGQLGRIEALVLQSPTVNLDLSYYLADGFNENVLGFYARTPAITTEGGFASGLMSNASGKNFYIVTTTEGVDLNNENTATSLIGKSVIGIGNGFITNYGLEASVGNFPTVNLSVEGLGFNVSTYTGAGATVSGIPTPAINPVSGTKFSTGTGNFVQLPIPSTGDGPAALRPGDIVLSFGAFTGTGATPTSNVDMTGINSINVQSVSLSLPMSRSPIERLGSRFAFARVVDFPITATMTVNAVVNEQVASNLADMVDDNADRTISLTFNSPGTSVAQAIYTFKGARLDSESYSSDIGSNKSVDLSFSTQIGGPNDTLRGIFFSGAAAKVF